MPRQVKATLVGIAIGLIGIGLSLSSPGMKFEEQIGLTWLFQMRGPIEVPDDVVVVAIDGSTGNKLDLPKLPYTWPRTIHAKAVERLVELGASVIVFDVNFQQSKPRNGDREFAAAISDANRVVLTQSLEGVRQSLNDIANWTESVQITPPTNTPPTGGQLEGQVWVEQLIPPAEVLAKAAYGMGPFPVPKTQGAVFQYWAFKPSIGDTATIPAVALQVHAMETYQEWLGMLEQAGGRDIAELPPIIKDATDLHEAMVTLRRLFRGDPELGHGLERAAEQVNLPDHETRLIQALRYLYSGEDNRYLNFYGPPGTIKTIPYQQVVSRQWKSLDVRNKAVFIGFSDIYNPGQQDWFYSVFTSDEGIDLSGVEIAATAFGNLLNMEALIPANTTRLVLVLFFFGFVLGVGIYLLPAIIAVPAALGVAALYGSSAQYAFNSMNLWLPMATPLLVQLPLAVFSGLLSHYLLERRKKREVTEAIAYYLPEDVVTSLGKGSFNSDSVNKVVYAACLSTDMAGFSSITEFMAPDRVASFINEYFEAVATPLKKHNVSVTEFRADAIMCAWTASQPEQHVRRAAISAALETRDAILRFSERTRTPLVARVGLQAGSVYIGHAGGGGHFVYSIVGDAANTASRIENLNEHLKTQLLATEAVTAGIEDLLLRPLGEFRLKQKTGVVKIVELLARGSDATPEQYRLCDRFAEALETFRNERWVEAASRFQAIVTDFHEDGPSAFYLDYCKRYIHQPPASHEPAVIRMQTK